MILDKVCRTVRNERISAKKCDLLDFLVTENNRVNADVYIIYYFDEDLNINYYESQCTVITILF